MIEWEHLWRVIEEGEKTRFTFSTNWNESCFPVYLSLLHVNITENVLELNWSVRRILMGQCWGDFYVLTGDSHHGNFDCLLS